MDVIIIKSRKRRFALPFLMSPRTTATNKIDPASAAAMYARISGDAVEREF
jgi:hypothetical protein